MGSTDKLEYVVTKMCCDFFSHQPSLGSGISANKLYSVQRTSKNTAKPFFIKLSYV